MTQADIARSTSERENVRERMSVRCLATVDVNRDSQGKAVDGGAMVQGREKDMASPVSEYQVEISLKDEHKVRYRRCLAILCFAKQPVSPPLQTFVWDFVLTSKDSN